MAGGAGIAAASELLELAVAAARSAGDVLLDRFAREATGVRTKSGATDLVSDADTAAERAIYETISAVRPDDGWVAEEGTAAESSTGVTWVADPLDATVNYLFRIPIWCVSIAAEDADGPVAGVVHDPNRNETFTASRGGGAFRNGEPIRVSDRADLSTALIATGFEYDRDLRAYQAKVVADVLPSVRDIRRAGSAALDLASVACGRVDGYYESSTERWDRAAGELLVREAGGVISDLPNPTGRSPGLIAAGPGIHAALDALVRR
ncbi:MAG TPA: inositol monophosphatase family protein [Actinomycetota bacterium]|nr:inositol monophosphatase family protein [Actinomycetota bacterium]